MKLWPIISAFFLDMGSLFCLLYWAGSWRSIPNGLQMYGLQSSTVWPLFRALLSEQYAYLLTHIRTSGGNES